MKPRRNVTLILSPVRARLLVEMCLITEERSWGQKVEEDR